MTLGTINSRLSALRSLHRGFLHLVKLPNYLVVIVELSAKEFKFSDCAETKISEKEGGFADCFIDMKTSAIAESAGDT